MKVTSKIFFKKINITYGNFTGSNKKRPLNSDAIENILVKYPQTNPEWLLTGKGEMLRELSASKTTSTKTANNKELEATQKKLIAL